jgi:hypothetical protein
MTDRKIKEAVQKLAGTHLKEEVTVTACTVDSVNKEQRTIDCTPIGGTSDTQIPSVRLQAEVADGFLLIPKVDSTVFVAYTTRLEPFVLQFSEVDQVLVVVGQSTLEILSDGKIRLNDGTYGGLVKIRELQAQLNKTNSLLSALIQILKGAPIPEPGNGAPSALQLALKSAIASQSLGDYSNIENTLITHGK